METKGIKERTREGEMCGNLRPKGCWERGKACGLAGEEGEGGKERKRKRYRDREVKARS
jgi:hypothetical protein